MAQRIEVRVDDRFPDALGQKVKKRITEDLKIPVEDIRIADVFTTPDNLSPDNVALLVNNLFSDSVVSTTTQFPLESKYDWFLEVVRKPGVADPEGGTASKASADIIKEYHPFSASKTYAIKGMNLTRSNIERIASDSIANSLIETYRIKNRDEYYRDNGFEAYFPRVKSTHKPGVEIVSLDLDDKGLAELSKNRLLSMNLEEMKAFKKYFENCKVRVEREKLGLPPGSPTDVEIEMLGQTWSEHCKHKIFNAEIIYTDMTTNETKKIKSLFKTYIQQPTLDIMDALGDDNWLVSVFSDNAGVIKFDDEYNLVMKVETHNTPSALDPYGGAITGIVGVNRDPLGTGLGARLIFNTDVLCFANPNYSGELPTRLKHPMRVMNGVVKGIEHGGNKSGIPTINGTIIYDSHEFGSVIENVDGNDVIISYMGKPLVYCGTGGIMPAVINGKPSHLKEVYSGDLIVMTGGKIGKDGIHGATFSSLRLDEDSPVTAVQIGDPITQKKMMDFLLEARDQGLYNSITDNGAGGLSSSVGEMAQMSGGCLLELEKCPFKYPGLDPWEILVSESQERMTLAVSPGKIDEFLALARKRDVEASVIGEFNNDGMFKATYKDGENNEKTVAYLDMDFLHNQVPRKHLKGIWNPRVFKEPEINGDNLDQVLLKMLSRLNICSKESVVRQYDHEVQAGTVVKPFTGITNDGPSDAAVIWPDVAKRKGSYKGVVVSNGVNPNYGHIDTYHMVASAIDEVLRNHVSVGGDPNKLAMLDNFCWANPEDPYRVAQLVRANMAIADYSRAFGTPFMSGKDSMKNEYAGEYRSKPTKIATPLTVLISGIGDIEDVRKAVTMDVKNPDNRLILLGETNDELGGSEYFAMKGQEAGEAYVGNNVPKVDAKSAKERYGAVHKAMQKGLIASCHDVSNGGLGTTISEMLFSGRYGGTIDLSKVPRGRKVDRNDTLLFSESNSRLLIEVPEENIYELKRVLRGPSEDIGAVTSNEYLEVNGLDGKQIIYTQIADLKEAWQRTLR